MTLGSFVECEKKHIFIFIKKQIPYEEFLTKLEIFLNLFIYYEEEGCHVGTP